MEPKEPVAAAEDVELAVERSGRGDDEDEASPSTGSSPAFGLGSRIKFRLLAFEKQMAHYNVEARGIERVTSAERREQGYMQIIFLWFSVNLAAVNITLGMLGPSIYGLSFTDASLCAVFGMLLGSVPVAYMATFGPVSGHRAMVVARYAMGWWPAKLVVVLNIIVLVGYSLIDVVIVGQVLSAVSGGSLSVIVGIVITSCIVYGITVFGYDLFHLYQRYAWLPQLITFCILAGVAGPKFDLSSPSVGPDAATIAGNRLSFFSLCLSAAITYAGAASDLFAYYPERAPRWKIFSMTMLGLGGSFAFAFILGIGLASGLAANADWANAYAVSQGALIVQAFAPLGTFGSFCSVLVALGMISNVVVPTYVSAIDFQVLGSVFKLIPRLLWTTLVVIIYTVCAIAGRSELAAIFTNFLALMGYWLSIWIAIFVEEHFLFRSGRFFGRRRRSGSGAGAGSPLAAGFDWAAWNNPSQLPVGAAALTAFLVGWAGAILSMDQVWYAGPLAKLVGQDGTDMGNYIGFSWAALVYPPLRWAERRHFGR